MDTDHVQEVDGAPEQSEKFVQVSISTTAGFFPAEGFTTVPSEQKVEVEMEKAMRTLEIKPTADWRATVSGSSGKRTIDLEKTYLENGLSGKIEIDWGPSEGGGG